MRKFRMVLLLTLLSSCAGSGFKGNSKAGEPKSNSKAADPAKLNKGTKTATTATTATTADVVAEMSSPMTENLPVLESPSVPPVAPVPPDAPVVAAPSFPAPSMVASEPLPNLVFGGGDQGAYRLGDGNFDPSSQCYGRLLASGNVSGTSLEFHFQLIKTTTLNLVKFSELCGVDDAVNRTATLSVMQFKDYSGNVLQNIPFYKKDNAVGIMFGPVQALPPGNYMLVVSSGFWAPIAGLARGDYDDFLVGRIDIQADAPIKRLGIITRGVNGNITQQLP